MKVGLKYDITVPVIQKVTYSVEFHILPYVEFSENEMTHKVLELMMKLDFVQSLADHLDGEPTDLEWASFDDITWSTSFLVTDFGYAGVTLRRKKERKTSSCISRHNFDLVEGDVSKTFRLGGRIDEANIDFSIPEEAQ